MRLIPEVSNFLGIATPSAWVENALQHEEILLIDHAHCEKKAASTALSLMYRYADSANLLHYMSRLAREELRHFEMVLKILDQRGFIFRHLTPSRYAAGLHRHIAQHEPQRRIDVLIIGAFIEARSCERFAQLVPVLPSDIADFYQMLLVSEARHFTNYLNLAREAAGGEDITARIVFFRQHENNLCTAEDSLFRFHSGPVSVIR